ncbi:hypothetical protein WISP_53576 [Willisornis vidua]|uniref:Uncharacterized protein n=1 Tax=Willisornis vidua TaxID=1566151 RepID=A0ABQ9DDE0_9PASS|nr:hypothetical protein WISP_53576 [Willisornis vidua]
MCHKQGLYWTVLGKRMSGKDGCKADCQRYGENDIIMQKESESAGARGHSMPQSRLESELLGSSSVEKDLGVLVDSQVSLSSMSWGPRSGHPGVRGEGHCQQGRAGILPLSSVLCLVLGWACLTWRREDSEGTSLIHIYQIHQQMDQALLSSAQRWDMRQWAETGTQEVPPEYEEELLYFHGD